MCTRADTSAAWGPPQLVAELSSASREGAASVSADGLTLVFASDRPGGFGGSGGWDMWLSIRKDRASAWEPPPAALSELNSEASDAEPWISDDLRLIYFSRSPPGSTSRFSPPFKIYWADR